MDLFNTDKSGYKELLEKLEQLEKANVSKDKTINDLQKGLKDQEDLNQRNQGNIYINKIAKSEVKPTFVVPFGNYTASLIDGQWFYKANENVPLIKKKVVAKYKDPVQYKIMEEYEKLSEDNYRNQLKYNG